MKDRRLNMLNDKKTILLERKHVKSLYEKLEKWPDASSICPQCNNVFIEKYKICDCLVYKQ